MPRFSERNEAVRIKKGEGRDSNPHRDRLERELESLKGRVADIKERLDSFSPRRHYQYDPDEDQGDLDELIGHLWTHGEATTDDLEDIYRDVNARQRLYQIAEDVADSNPPIQYRRTGGGQGEQNKLILDKDQARQLWRDQ